MEVAGKLYWYWCKSCNKDLVTVGLQPGTTQNNLGLWCYNPKCPSFGTRITNGPLEISREMIPMTNEEYEAEKKRREEAKKA